jgi:tyrosinase
MKYMMLFIVVTMGASGCAVLPTCPSQLLPVVEIQVNNSESSHDDYIDTRGFTPCRARITNVNRAVGRGLNFPGGVEVEIRNRRLASDLTISPTGSGTSTAFFSTLPGNGDWLPFFIRGNTTSTTDKSAIIEMATAGATCNEVVLSRKGLMVPSGAPPIAPAPARPRVAVEVGSVSHLDDYISWAPTSCRIKWLDAPTSTATLNVTLRNMPGTNRLRFAGTSPASGSTATNPTITVTLNGDGSWAQFYIAGNNGNASLNDKDAVMKVIDPANNLLSREAVMVRIRKNVNSLTPAERDRYLEALREVHQTYNFYNSFLNSHSQVGAGFLPVAHRQAHNGSGFLPWHRAFVLHIERLLQASDPSVAVPYWHFDQSSPNMFHADFVGATAAAGNMVSLSPTNPISSWQIPGQIAGIRRRTPYGDSGIPGSVTGTTTPVITETATLGLGSTYANFKGMEANTHNGAHNNSGNTISWIAGSPAFAPRDPLFYFLHCNIDRLWAKWQWVNNRYDATQANTYDLQGSHASPPAAQAPDFRLNAGGQIIVNRTLGQYIDDSMWPWDNVNGGTGTAERPAVSNLTPFPITLGGFLPGSRPTVKSTIDFRVINFGYDDIYPY